MKALVRILWWSIYTAGALIVQQHIAGVDALMPGFLLSLQEKKYWQSFWLLLLFVVIQEGTGNFYFGGALLWYVGQIALFHLGQKLFVADNILFVLMLSAGLGVYRGVVILFMCAVQSLPVHHGILIEECAIQALIIPLVWSLAYFSRPLSVGSQWVRPHGH